MVGVLLFLLFYCQYITLYFYTAMSLRMIFLHQIIILDAYANLLFYTPCDVIQYKKLTLMLPAQKKN